MNDATRKQARDLAEEAAVHDAEVAGTFEELLNLEKQMAVLANMVLRTNQTAEGFIGSEAESAMMAVAREQAKHDPELAAMLKELDESEKRIAGLTEMLGSA